MPGVLRDASPALGAFNDVRKGNRLASVGIFDSGIGGLTVWREIIRRTPSADTFFVADQQHIPYGARNAAEIRAFAFGITRFLVSKGCDVVVVACNTASAVALQALRGAFTGVQFVGMEPAVKPASTLSRSKVVAVLATPTTLQGELLEHTAAHWAADVEIVRQPCPGLVELIEAGEAGAPLRELLETVLQVPREAGADTIVLACTHYPFVRDAIQDIVGPSVHIIDPAAAVARQVERVAPPSQNAADAVRRVERSFWTSGDPQSFERVAQHWMGVSVDTRVAAWKNGLLEEGDRLPRPAPPVTP